MYITTFYSYKGGVGRTLALANVGVELAKRGRRVLLVDFDLEAPGLDTFADLRAESSDRGLVDYVVTSLEKGEPQNVLDYMYEARHLATETGRLWIMPAGKRDGQYGRKLASIDWSSLYRQNTGYLLVEDLKAQWAERLSPDYVLIDSRTGHTEESGICTRQLADAVVVLFIPNQQNLVGLQQIVRSIRSHDEIRERKTGLHFVVSNVPDLDDEEQILGNLMRRFESELGYSETTATIHRYDSLALLDQSLFILDRPKSRLAREYRGLADAIVEENLEDREGALSFLRRRARTSRKLGRRAIEERIDRIRERHMHDPEILFEAAKLYRRYGRSEHASLTLEHAIRVARGAGQDIEPRVLLERAELYALAGEKDSAVADITEALNGASLDRFDVRRAIDLLTSVNPSALTGIASVASIRNLEPGERHGLTASLMSSREGQAAAVLILQEVLTSKKITVEQSEAVVWDLVLCLIGLGRFDDAVEMSGVRMKPVSDLLLHEAFNLAMAEWGRHGSPPSRLLERVIELDQKGTPHPNTPNYDQCVALALFLLQRSDEAAVRLNLAERAMRNRAFLEFSCWSYLRVPPERFIRDIREMRHFFAGELKRPSFMPK